MAERNENSASPSADERAARAIRFGRRVDWMIAVVIMVIAIGFIMMLQSLPQRATFFPWFITCSIMIVGAIYGYGKITRPGRWDSLYRPVGGSVSDPQDSGPAFVLDHVSGILRTLLIFIALIAATVALGPEIAVPLFLTIMLWSSGESAILAVPSGIGFWLIIHFVFGDAMSINLPTGYLTDALF